MGHLLGRFLPCAFLACATAAVAIPRQPDDDAVVQRLMDFELEDLARLPVTVTSVSKRPEQRSQAASAIFVIGSEDLRRAAVTSVPEALRMVPGLHVAHLDANKWAITSRGFGGEFANKLLVLIDGRSVYTPLFAGVYWDVQDLLIEDIDRIEVIRGPGATVWGANAVNGVINILTRRADQTPGGLVTAHAGDEEQIVGARYGLRAGADSHWRVWARSRHIDGFARADGTDAGDDWDLNRVGFRFDNGSTTAGGWTFTGEVYEGDLKETDQVPSFAPPFGVVFAQDMQVSGGHLLGRWDRALGDGNRVTVQAYYDRTERERPGVLSEDRDTFDVEFDHRVQVAPEQELIWGLGYRATSDEISDSAHIQLRGDERDVDLSSAFFQYNWRLDNGHVTLGSKLSHNDYSGFEVQPSLRGSWSVTETDILWASVSRAVRTPSRGERDALLDIAILPPQQPQAPPTVIRLTGNDDFDAEDLVAYEAGYRKQLSATASLDVAAFYNDYDNLISVRAGEPELVFDPVPHVVAPLLFVNSGEGTAHGVEVSLDFLASDSWRLLAGYSYLKLDLGDDPGSPGVPGLASLEGQSPRHQGFLRSQLNLAPGWELDASLYYVDELTAFSIDDHTRLDLRLGWRPRDHVLLSLGGKNLLDSQHPEFGRSLFSLPSERQRSVYLQLVYELR